MSSPASMFVTSGGTRTFRPCGACDGCRWGGACTARLGRLDALTDLHDGKGTRWVKRPDGSYYPDCPCHGPEASHG